MNLGIGAIRATIFGEELQLQLNLNNKTMVIVIKHNMYLYIK